MKDDNKQDTWLGINTIQAEDPSKNNALFGIPTTVSNQNSDPNKDYESPAIQQYSIFLNQLALENKPFDEQSASRFRLIKQSLKPEEILKFIPASFYANLLQRDMEFAKSQSSENSSKDTTKEQQEALAKQQQEAQQILANQQLALEERKWNAEQKNMDEREKGKCNYLIANQIEFYAQRQSPTIQNSVNNVINRSRDD